MYPTPPSTAPAPKWGSGGCAGGLLLGGDPQDLGNFFLERDDRVCPLQFTLERGILGFELLHAQIDSAAEWARACARAC